MLASPVAVATAALPVLSAAMRSAMITVPAFRYDAYARNVLRLNDLHQHAGDILGNLDADRQHTARKAGAAAVLSRDTRPPRHANRMDVSGP